MHFAFHIIFSIISKSFAINSISQSNAEFSAQTHHIYRKKKNIFFFLLIWYSYADFTVTILLKCRHLLISATCALCVPPILYMYACIKCNFGCVRRHWYVCNRIALVDWYRFWVSLYQWLWLYRIFVYIYSYEYEANRVMHIPSADNVKIILSKKKSYTVK